MLQWIFKLLTNFLIFFSDVTLSIVLQSFFFFFIFLKKIDHDEQQEITPPFFNQCQCQCTRSANSMFSLKNLEIIIKLFYGRENCLMFPIKALTKTSFKFSKEDSFCEKVHYYLFSGFLYSSCMIKYIISTMEAQLCD